jgi:hypothetical protein
MAGRMTTNQWAWRPMRRVLAKGVLGWAARGRNYNPEAGVLYGAYGGVSGRVLLGTKVLLGR